MNNEWARDIEQLLSNYINDMIHREMPQEDNTQEHDTSAETIRERFATRRYYSLLSEYIHEYNANMRLYQESMRLYQENMRLILQNIYDIRQSRSNTRTSLPRRNEPPVATTLFSYILHTPENASNVPVTPAQRNSATEIIPYTSSMNETRCPICLEDFEEGEQICRIIACGHIFKRPGLMRWFERNNHCPVCRQSVIDMSGNNVQRDIPRNQYMNPLFSINQAAASPLFNDINMLFRNFPRQSDGTTFPLFDMSFNATG